jgi:hypothetical protein
MILKPEDKNFAFRDALALEIFRDAYALDQVRIRAVEGVDRALKVDRQSFAQIDLREGLHPRGVVVAGSCAGRSVGGAAGAVRGDDSGAVVRFTQEALQLRCLWVSGSCSGVSCQKMRQPGQGWSGRPA